MRIKLLLSFLFLAIFCSNELYASDTVIGRRRIPLQNNMVKGVNTLTQDMIKESNAIYVVQNNYELIKDLQIPENCVLEFEGGSIGGNKIITLNNTLLQGNTSINCDFEGTIANEMINVSWFGVVPNAKCHDRFQKVLDLYASNVPNNPWDFWPRKPEPKIVIPNGVYDLGTVYIRSYVTIEGQGAGGTVLRDTYIKGSDIYNTKISNLVFRNSNKSVDAGSISLSKKNIYKVAIDLDHGSFISLEN